MITNVTLAVLAVAFLIRLFSLKISVSHEKAIKLEGGKEYGALNSKFLAIAHFSYYIGSGIEAYLKNPPVNQYTYWGIGLFLFSMAMLGLVIYSLREIWTVKLYILKNHELNRNGFFKAIRHPNYFLNIIPELLAIALICQSWNVFAVGFPLYMIPLIIRIIQEEKIMRATFAKY